MARGVFYILLFLWLPLAMSCNHNKGCNSVSTTTLQGIWYAKRLPLVQGITAEEYAAKMGLLTSDTVSFSGFCFLHSGKAHYYPYIQADGSYIPGNKIEGQWDVRNDILYFAEGTLPLTPLYEIEMRDSTLLLHQTKQMQLSYLQTVISECNKRISKRSEQRDFLEYASVLSRFAEMQRIVESMPEDFATTYTFAMRNDEPKEIDEERDAALIVPKKEPRYRYTE
jgi:lipoprotein